MIFVVVVGFCIDRSIIKNYTKLHLVQAYNNLHLCVKVANEKNDSIKDLTKLVT